MRLTWLFVTVLAMCVPDRASSAAEISFERDVRPIFKTHCFQCHGEGDEREGNLDLRLRRLAVAGGDSGAGDRAGKAEESLLYRRIRDGEMPPGKKKLRPRTRSRGSAAGSPPGRRRCGRSRRRSRAGTLITEEERSHWSFQPVKRPAPPAVQDRRARAHAHRRLPAGQAARAAIELFGRGRQGRRSSAARRST